MEQFLRAPYISTDAASRAVHHSPEPGFLMQTNLSTSDGSMSRRRLSSITLSSVGRRTSTQCSVLASASLVGPSLRARGQPASIPPVLAITSYVRTLCSRDRSTFNCSNAAVRVSLTTRFSGVQKELVLSKRLSRATSSVPALPSKDLQL